MVFVLSYLGINADLRTRVSVGRESLGQRGLGDAFGRFLSSNSDLSGFRRDDVRVF